LTGRRAAERYAGWLERDGLEVAARIGGTALRAALDNAALYRIAIVRQRHHPAAKASSPARSTKARPRAKRGERSSATLPTSSTAASSPAEATPAMNPS